MAKTTKSRFELFQFKLEFLGLKLVIFILRLMSLEAGSALMGRVWQTIAPWTHRHGRTLDHLALAFPDKPTPELERIARASWRNLGQTFAESLQIDRLMADPSRITGNDAEIIESMEDNGGGGILVSFHHGNWEVASSVAVRNGVSPAGIYQKIKNPYVDDLVARARAPYYPAGLFRKDQKALRDLMKVAQKGGYVSTLVDLREGAGVEIDFFGRPAPSNPIPAMLACRYDRPIALARITRLPGVRFRVDAVLIPVSRTGNLDDDIRLTTQAIQSQIETWLIEQPEQWMWAHKRWA